MGDSIRSVFGLVKDQTSQAHKRFDKRKGEEGERQRRLKDTTQGRTVKPEKISEYESGGETKDLEKGTAKSIVGDLLSDF